MAVSKRTRYEVLRRDNHACRYCGAVAPDATLTVDHVTPVSLGGTDEPSNLVAACKDCNAGKASSSPDATLVADVDQDAIRWAATLRAALQDTAVDIKALNKVRKAFLAAWGPGHKSDLPSDYISTIEQWVKLGVPIEVMTYSAEVASGKTGLRYGDRFRYACGIVWRKVDGARDKAAPTGSAKAEQQRCGHCFGCIEDAKNPSDPEPYGCRILTDPEDYPPCRLCGSRTCLYEDGAQEAGSEGYSKGWDVGWGKAWDQAHDLYRPAGNAEADIRLVVDNYGGHHRSTDGYLSLYIPAVEEARRGIEAGIAERGITALVDESAAKRDPWMRQECPF